jgi:AraC-like DNA-binding protein
MKLLLEDIPSKQGGASFYRTKIFVPGFEFKWHFHPEYELTYIVKGNGYRVVGDSYERFAAGDLVLLGSNLPHTWCGTLADGEPSEALVIQFSQSFIEPFACLNEGLSIQKLLAFSSRGICFQFSDRMHAKLNSLVHQTNLESVLSLLSILDELSQHSFTSLASINYRGIVSKQFETRINKVCSYLKDHYKEPVHLPEVASLVFMSESNFCKFFKKATRVTFSDYLKDLRINEACALLCSTDDSISHIARSSGFESLSYFNRVFRSKKGQTPSQFRNQQVAALGSDPEVRGV